MAQNERPIGAFALVAKLSKKVRFGRIEYDDVLAVIADAPTVDVVEVVHGRWKRTNWQVCMGYTCPFCGYMYSEGDPAYPPEKYCCKCGARNE